MPTPSAGCAADVLGLLWLVPALPLAGFVILALAGSALGARGIALVGAGSVGLAAFLALLVAAAFLASPFEEAAYRQTLWQWMAIGPFTPNNALYLDRLSLVMVLVVTVVGFLIHLYSTEFMGGDEGYRRFFAYMNLFVAAMLVLVLADNLVFLYLGWEGVGLCSYLLIGFWYRDPANGRAARKAFIVTRAGDAAMALGLFLLFATLDTLDIQAVLERARAEWPVGSGLAVASAALLLAGAVGKSAQLPLQVWLPDAMAGPTPVSALIHAATMVTAGVYLIARTHVLFELAPPVQSGVAVIGALTLLLAACAALAQRDIKRVLAYSTISQIGYMFLALGVGAWTAAIFHLMTHAFFKALLFLAAGVVILALHEEHDLHRMGGLRRHLPLAFWTFLIGAAALSALPLVTAGFYSKDLILAQAWSAPEGGVWLWLAGAIGSVLTGVYIFRAVFLAFFGEARARPVRDAGPAIAIALVCLAALSVLGGILDVPAYLAGPLPALPAHGALWLEIVSAVLSLAGIALAWWLFFMRPGAAAALGGMPVARYLEIGWGFDWLYERLFLRPFLAVARFNRGDAIDLVYDGLALLSLGAHRELSRTQTGRLRWYASGLAAGAAAVLLVVMVLT
jgi:NADH-quinone oxidoreductase subunit L